MNSYLWSSMAVMCHFRYLRLLWGANSRLVLSGITRSSYIRVSTAVLSAASMPPFHPDSDAQARTFCKRLLQPPCEDAGEILGDRRVVWYGLVPRQVQQARQGDDVLRVPVCEAQGHHYEAYCPSFLGQNGPACAPGRPFGPGWGPRLLPKKPFY